MFTDNYVIISGKADTTINCMNDAIPGKKTTLSCEITGTIAGGIEWIRPNDGLPRQVINCNIANEECSLNTGITGYSVVIDPATQKQTLTIDSFSPTVDAGNWTCRDGDPGAGQRTCKKNYKSKSEFLLSTTNLATVCT